jgi:hypothetical protein
MRTDQQFPPHKTMKTKTCIAAMLATIGAIGTTWAAVALDVSKPPVVGPPGTGPFPQDPNAVRGQWFSDNTSRQYEFYDNAQGFGGGSNGTQAIKGIVTSITFSAGPGTAITAFQVTATVTNDTTPVPGFWNPGNNSHGELLNTFTHYVGDMPGTRMTIEFALSSLSLQPNTWSLPYTQYQPEIIANNEDATAWYCNSNDLQNPGNFYVPAWDFGTILMGQSATRVLDFSVNGGINPITDPRYNPLVTSFTDGASDILMNRTTSLKISNWVDGIWVDNVTYPNGELGLDSNASVFFVPEAGTSALLGLLGILALRRRR